ncbi:hypothetical protein S40288_01294 [Stachybotrys chartarum IBT 40288]|nr:hypothetical protein S40288_01294 [Stachybotrys chartarum IBT 40288]
MPATNRGVQIAPADTISTSGEYLRGLPPSWTTPTAGLAVFALLLFLALRARRSCPCSLKATTRLSRNHNPTVSPDQQDLELPCPPTWSMDEKQSRPKGITGPPSKGQHVTFQEDESAFKKPLSIDVAWKRTAGDGLPRQLMSRPPPAPPLTPPELSTAVFTFEDRPRHHESFLQQPNPDYLSSTSTSLSQSGSASPPTPRRRSYNKTLPIGIPTPQSSTISDIEPADLTFSPSSFPPTSPCLPPAPPGMTGPDDDVKAQQEIDVRGEIISVLDGDGAGWTRHTRVYGGGVCLACAASGGDHGGGFYGATVSPEEMR